MLDKLKEFNRRQQFEPGLFSLFFNANHFIKRGVFRGVVSHAKSCSGRLLDVGCGNKPYRKYFNVDEYIGIDIHNEAHDHTDEPVDVFYDGKNIPFPSERFDSVFSSEVFEHVFQLEELIREINRVLVPGGTLLITLPFVWIEHEKPNDFARYSSFGIKDLLERNGFEVVKKERSSTFIETLAQLEAAYVYNTLLPRNPILRMAGTLLLVAPINISGTILSKLLPDNPDLYLNNIILARKSQPATAAGTGLSPS